MKTSVIVGEYEVMTLKQHGMVKSGDTLVMPLVDRGLSSQSY
jgi:hypothetical protein